VTLLASWFFDSYGKLASPGKHSGLAVYSDVSPQRIQDLNNLHHNWSHGVCRRGAVTVLGAIKQSAEQLNTVNGELS
jgi:hypothetical protein